MVNMAFGQTELVAFNSWGVAPGYGEGWPSAKRKPTANPVSAEVSRQDDGEYGLRPKKNPAAIVEFVKAATK